MTIDHDLLTGQATTTDQAPRSQRRRRREPGRYSEDDDGGWEPAAVVGVPTVHGRLGASAAAGDPQATFLSAIIRASEDRTMREIRDLRDEVRDDLDNLRGEVRDAFGRFMPAERITDRWRQDEQRDRQLDTAMTAQQQTLAQLNTLLPTLATGATVKAAVAEAVAELRREYPTTVTVERLIDEKVKAATANFATPDQVEKIIAAAHEKQWERTRNLILIAATILGLLAANNIIHLSALFGGH